ncbi:LCDV orf2-like protein [Grouper iridovirus]|uniref:LCDV orf2-like protein n=1 Tax=Grouper iridovirus TaxID=127569 RepID=Q5GAI7_9VIRU|nr:LCDV orf2-like protein [Grouper iridovirus]
MIVTINDKSVAIPVGISFDEWINSLAKESAPKYIAWKPKRPNSFKDVINPFWTGENFDLLRIVRNQETLKFPRKEIDEWLPHAVEIQLEDLERIFVATHQLIDMMGFAAIIEQELREIDPDTAIQAADRLRSELEKELSYARTVTTAWKRRLSSLREVRPAPGMEQPKLLRTVFSGALPELGDLTALELLDAARPTQKCPYITAGAFVKTMLGFKPSAEWQPPGESDNGPIFFKANSEKDNQKALKDAYRKYSNAAIIQSETGAMATFDVQQGGRFVDPVTFADRVLECVNLRVSGRRLIEVGRIVSVTVPNFSFYAYVLTDLMMTHPIISHVMQVDELTRAHKIKSVVYAQMSATGQTVAFQERQTDDGNPYLHLRIRARDERAAEEIAEAAMRVIAVYKQEEKSVLREYAMWDKEAAKHLKLLEDAARNGRPEEAAAGEDPASKKGLKALAPEIFLPTYSRKCLHMPVILKGADLEKARAEKRPLMQFPLFGESKTHTYACMHPQHIYPGLRENQLPNKSKYPYVPCCYSKDQQTRPNSKWFAYLNRIPVNGAARAADEDEPAQEGLQAEPLPEGALIFLRSLLGVERGSRFFALRSSNPETVVHAVFLATRQRSPSQEEQAAERAAMAGDPSALAACAQELYADAEEDWSAWARELADPSVPLDGFRFFRALETRYDCDIYFMDNKGLLHTPSVRGRLRYRPRRQTVILHVRETTYVPLIVPPVNWTRGPVQNGILTFSPIDDIVVLLYEHYQDTAPVYLDGVRMAPLRSDWLPCTGQVFDSMGKTRMMEITPKDGRHPRFALVTFPMPPMSAPMLAFDYVPPRPDLDKVLGFLRQRFVVTGYRRAVNTGSVREVTGLLDGAVECCILTNWSGSSFPFANAVYGGPALYDKTRQSMVLEAYAQAEKKARMMVEYVKKAIIMKRGKCDLNEIKRFVTDGGITITPDAAKGALVFAPRFETPGPFATADWSVKTPDVKTARKLVYSLRVASVNGTCDDVSYKNLRLVPKFYTTASDFKTGPGFMVNLWKDTDRVVRKTRKAVINWEQGLAVEWPLPDTEIGNSYIIRFTGMPRTFLAMNHPSWMSAAWAVHVWTEKDYCPGVTENAIPAGAKIPVYACVKGYRPTPLKRVGAGHRLNMEEYGSVTLSGVMIYKAGYDKPLQYVSLLM